MRRRADGRLGTGLVLAAAGLLAACATGPAPYGPADTSGGLGYEVQQIESSRFRVSYRARDGATARDYALLRAAEVTLDAGDEWFRVVGAYTDAPDERSGETSVSVGGSSGSYGSSVGVGIGIGLGGGRSETVHDLEILTGSGPKPALENVYDARAVRASLSPGGD